MVAEVVWAVAAASGVEVSVWGFGRILSWWL
jgi:hypothetical protein